MDREKKIEIARHLLECAEKSANRVDKMRVALISESVVEEERAVGMECLNRARRIAYKIPSFQSEIQHQVHSIRKSLLNHSQVRKEVENLLIAAEEAGREGNRPKMEQKIAEALRKGKQIDLNGMNILVSSARSVYSDNFGSKLSIPLSLAVVA